MAEAILTVNGQRYGGWERVEISMSMECIANSFSFTASEKFPGKPDAWVVLPGDACTVSIGDKTVITGYVDEVNPTMGPEEHSITISGRDKTGDLVDCAAVHKSGEWHKATFLRIATDICLPFGIKVITKVDVGKPFSSFSIWRSESAFECLERAARMRGLLLVSDGMGNLVITRAGTSVVSTPLILGQNIEQSSGQFSWKDRYSQYAVLGQAGGGGNPWAEGNQKKHLQTMATIKDNTIKRYRPLIIIAEQGDGSTYKDRAIWERNIRRGRCQRVTYAVSGWEHSSGVWRPNTLVPVQDPTQRVNGFLIICGVRLRLDEQGTRAELSCTSPGAYELINLPDKHKHKKEEAANVWN